MNAQEYPMEWTQRAGGREWDQTGPAIMLQGSSFVVSGYFTHETWIDSIHVRDNRSFGAFISVLDSAGEVRQVNHFSSNGFLKIHAMSSEKNDHLLLIAGAWDTLFFSEHAIEPYSPGQIYLLELNLDLSLIRSFPLACGMDIQITSLHAVGEDTILLGGHFKGTCSVADTVLHSSHKRDAFVCSLINFTTLDWIRIISGKGDQILKELKMTDKNIILAGDFNQELSIANRSLVSFGSTDIFLGALKLNGSLYWLSGEGGPGEDHVNNFCIQEDSLVLVTGGFSRQAEIAGQKVISVGRSDLFLASFTLDGSPRKLKSWGGPSDDTGTHLSPGHGTSIFLAGKFKDRFLMGSHEMAPTDRFYNAFVAEIIYPDSVRWIKILSGSSEIQITNLNMDIYGDLYCAARYAGNLHVKTADYQSKGKQDIAFLKLYNPCLRLQFTLGSDRTLCEGRTDTLDAGDHWIRYEWNNGLSTGKTLPVLSSGSYQAKVLSQEGCWLSDTIRVFADTLQIAYDVVNEQLPDGNNGSIDLHVTGNFGPFLFLWSTGAIVEDLKNISKGIYTVSVTDQAGCNAYEEIKVESSQDQWIRTLPNPFCDHSTIMYYVATETFVQLSLFDENAIQLKILDQGIRLPGIYIIDLRRDGLPSGIYLIRMQTGKQLFVRKIIITDN